VLSVHGNRGGEIRNTIFVVPRMRRGNLQTRKKVLLWLIVLALVMACAPTLATPFPTADPGSINTFIARTANAAASQTAAVLPTNTPTQTPTPRPANTETPSLTPTSTVIFILSSPTRFFLPTSISIGGATSSSGGGATSSEDLDCQVIRVSPANGTIFDPRTSFDAIWRVQNIGQQAWDHNSIDVIYNGGARIHQIGGYDLDRNVKVGEIIDITVDMEAPRDSASYTTHWVLRASAKTFCKMSLTINVR